MLRRNIYERAFFFVLLLFLVDVPWNESPFFGAWERGGGRGYG